MENGSRAIIIASSILIAMIIVGFMLFAYNRISSLQKSKDRSVEVEKIIETNKKLESYDKRVVRGNDLISLINLANSVNTRNLEKDEYGNFVEDEFGYVEVKIWASMDNPNNNGAKFPAILQEPYASIMSSNKISKNSKNYYLMNEYIKMLQEEESKEELNKFKNLYFECDGIEYDKKNVAVKGMYFTNIVRLN